MAVPSLTDTWRITYAMHVGSPPYPAQVVVHVTCPTLSDAQAVANEAGAAWTVANSYKSLQCNVVAYDQITVQPYDGNTAPLPCTVAGYTNTVGGTIGQAVPAQVAALTTKKSLSSGRRNRGRMYVPGLPVSLVSSDGVQWTSTGITGINAANAAWKTKLEGGPLITKLVVYSHKYNSKVNVSQLLARSYFGTQRRRSEP